MKLRSAAIAAALPVFVLAQPAAAQSLLEDQVEEDSRDGEVASEMEERVFAGVLENFISMDENDDFLVSENEWSSWAGWGELAADFAPVDANSTGYVTIRELEEAYIRTGDSRMANEAHGVDEPVSAYE